jgi:hypothetical protein
MGKPRSLWLAWLSVAAVGLPAPALADEREGAAKPRTGIELRLELPRGGRGRFGLTVESGGETFTCAVISAETPCPLYDLEAGPARLRLTPLSETGAPLRVFEYRRRIPPGVSALELTPHDGKRFALTLGFTLAAAGVVALIAGLATESPDRAAIVASGAALAGFGGGIIYVGFKTKPLFLVIRRR